MQLELAPLIIFPTSQAQSRPFSMIFICGTRQVNLLREKIQGDHLQFLMENDSCLVTDTTEIAMDDENREISRKSLLCTKFPWDKVKEQWIWEFDTLKTYHSGHRTFREVVALNFNDNGR